MKKERKIIIKSLWLRKIRSILRTILLEATFSGDLKPNKGTDRLNVARHSICQCAMGSGCRKIKLPVGRHHRVDLDMAYVPFLKRWFCLKCFEFIKKREDFIKKVIDPDYIVPDFG
ncbi:MAG: hypothetical protein GF383_13235 [Candidatus Lokiarchaeota archaeon]|nr:hypothetical protein [Candidatus Lokiarchaeota archaeon]MBD3342128.1 hypothetical protein [Candidatus Lokiarchaeota archaeon]